MTKYLRRKSDGRVYDWNPHMAEGGLVEEFQYDGVVPESIPDLLTFLQGKPEKKGPARGVKVE